MKERARRCLCATVGSPACGAEAPSARRRPGRAGGAATGAFGTASTVRTHGRNHERGDAAREADRGISPGSGARPGVTMIELLVVMMILAIIVAYISRAALRAGPRARVERANAQIAIIAEALDHYHEVFGEYPPDTGFGLDMTCPRPVYTELVGGDTVVVPTYDPGSLWRYLIKEVEYPADSEKYYGPFLKKWPSNQLKAYEDPLYPDKTSFYVTDPWGTPYGYVGSAKRVLHHGTFDIFSCGPDRVTACNDGESQSDTGIPGCPSNDPQSTDPADNRAYNCTKSAPPKPSSSEEIDDEVDGVQDEEPNNSAEFGPEASYNGNLSDDPNSWSPR